MEHIPKINQKAKEISITPEELAGMIDYTKLSPYETEDSIKKLCEEAISYQFHSVCVNPYYTEICAERLKGEEVKVDTAVGFPLGQNTRDGKAFEAEKAVEDGTDEIDMVMNIGAFRNGEYDIVRKDIKSVVDASGDSLVKVIIETGYLTYEEIEKASELVEKSGADFVKNSTGFGPYGANIPHIYLMNKSVGEDSGVKAAGGISDFRDALRMISAGANRIGASRGKKIVDSLKQANHPKEWTNGENPCKFCPTQMNASVKAPKSISEYYKSKCKNCPHQNR